VFKTIRPLYTGTLTWNSKIKRVDEKAAKNQIKTAQVAYFEVEGKKVQVMTHVTINFTKFEDMELFEKAYKEAVASLPKPQ